MSSRSLARLLSPRRSNDETTTARLSLNRATRLLELAGDTLKILTLGDFDPKTALVGEQIDGDLGEPCGGVGNHTFTFRKGLGSIERNAKDESALADDRLTMRHIYRESQES